MKTYSIFVVIVLTLVSLSFVSWVAEPTKPPEVKPDPAPKAEDLPMPPSGPYGKVEVTEREFDFGAKSVGETDSHQFTLKNVGEGPLEFLLGKTSCQCTVGDITKENGEVLRDKNDSKVDRGTLAPGETMHLRVEWVMKAPNEKFRQTVPVFTTDPDLRQVQFAIVGTVSQQYQMQPDGVWNVGDMPQNEPAKAEGHFFSNILDDFTLTSEVTEESKLKVTIDRVDVNDTVNMKNLKCAYKVLVEVSPDRHAGRFKETFKLKAVSSQGEKEQEVIVIGNKTGPIEIRGLSGAGYDPTTDRLIFRDFPAATGAKATMTLFIKGFDGDLAIQSIEPANTQVKIQLLDTGTTLGKSKAYKAQVEIPAGAPVSHRFREAELVTLKLNHPDCPEFTLLIDYNALR